MFGKQKTVNALGGTQFFDSEFMEKEAKLKQIKQDQERHMIFANAALARGNLHDVAEHLNSYAETADVIATKMFFDLLATMIIGEKTKFGLILELAKHDSYDSIRQTPGYALRQKSKTQKVGRALERLGYDTAKGNKEALRWEAGREVGLKDSQVKTHWKAYKKDRKDKIAQSVTFWQNSFRTSATDTISINNKLIATLRENIDQPQGLIGTPYRLSADDVRWIRWSHRLFLEYRRLSKETKLSALEVGYITAAEKANQLHGRLTAL